MQPRASCRVAPGDRLPSVRGGILDRLAPTKDATPARQAEEAGTMTKSGPLRIAVDDRERADGKVLAALTVRGDVVVEIARLEAGDYRVERRVVVEGKTAADFAASLIDGPLGRNGAVAGLSRPAGAARRTGRVAAAGVSPQGQAGSSALPPAGPPRGRRSAGGPALGSIRIGGVRCHRLGRGPCRRGRHRPQDCDENALGGPGTGGGIRRDLGRKGRHTWREGLPRE